MLWGLDLHSWEQAMIISLAGAALAALAVVITTGAVVVLTRASNEEAKAELTNANTEIARAHARTDEAQAQIERAKENAAFLANEAARANLTAADAGRQAAAANQRAAEATLKAEEERHERLKLEAKIAPRDLTEEQQARITEAMRPFAGQRFETALQPGNAEADRLLKKIEDALAAAGWTQTDWDDGGIRNNRAGRKAAGLATVSNVFVDVHPKYKDALWVKAEALVAALLAEDIAAIADSRPTSLDTEAIHILIGPKM